MTKYLEKADPIHVAVISVKGMMAFPGIPVSFQLEDAKLRKICEQVYRNNDFLLLLAEKDNEDPKDWTERYYDVGTVLKVKQILNAQENTMRVIADCICRASVREITVTAEGVFADAICKVVEVEKDGGVKGEVLVHELLAQFDHISEKLPKLPSEIKDAIRAIKDPGLLADLIACNLLLKDVDKQSVLAEFDPLRRAELVLVLLEREEEYLDIEFDLHKRVRDQIDENQRRYYLQEQLRVIQDELDDRGDDSDDGDDEIREYNQKIKAAELPEEVSDKLYKEVKKLAKMPYASAESSVLRSYLDTCLEIPWKAQTKDRVNLKIARNILEREHYGLEKIKQRVLEFLAVRKLNPDLNSQILCLVGPPGTGKTSIAASLARAMNRTYVRVSLGGVRDEADIRGHRKTYIGSMPGRIIDALIKAKVRNPLILLDEVDKMTHDAHGDPASALLEVLDAEQNHTFRDHFVELPIDLSNCVFVATANTLETVPRPLIDRMEIMELSIYTRYEKLAIAKEHLLPKQRKRHGLDAKTLKVSDDAILEIIDYYTLEAGVRNLERELAAVCRKVAMEIVEGKCKKVTVLPEDIAKYLGTRKTLPDHIYEQNEVGVVNGLAYTEVGGDMLRVEATAMPGSGKIELTGSLGNVMKESAHIAVSYLRAHANELGISDMFYKEQDLHIHVPEGAVPKDGPSAGVTIVTALASELSGKPVKRDVAMTGEVTLRGRVLPIGGLKEKTMAAYRCGIKTVLFPKENEKDLSEIDPLVRKSLTWIPCTHVSEVLEYALCK